MEIEEHQMIRTKSTKLSEIEHRWFVVDAAGQTLGRLATVVAGLLTGKHKPTWAPHLDSGDFVIVLNAEKVVLTGRKEEQKVYYRHSGYPGGMKRETAGKLRRRRPEQLLERAVRGMLPKNSLGRKQFRKLKVYAGEKHRHQAQQPVPFDLTAAS
jgi:large subunit ribosomal protein L13